jgi:nucleotide-binding universal stress UspA family protein
LLFGSVAEAVLRMADIPVFTVRAAHLEAAMRVA